MAKQYSLADQTFGRLTVLFKLSEKHRTGQTLWRCVCHCGTEVDVPTSRLVNGNKKSCGCLAKDTAREKATTHGMHGTKLYSIWESMRRRCNDVNHDNYQHYGGSGIAVFEEWDNNPSAFFKWALDNGYREGLSLDRKCNGLGYSPENCRFINRTCQGLNKNITSITYRVGNQKNPYSVYIGLLCKRYYFGAFKTEAEALSIRKLIVDSFIDKYGSMLDSELTRQLVIEFTATLQNQLGIKTKSRTTK